MGAQACSGFATEMVLLPLCSSLWVLSAVAAAPIRVGVIGAGDNTKRYHIPLLQQIEGVEVTTVVNRSPESTARAGDLFGIHGRASSWREVVDDPDVDAVVIGTWPYMHRDITLAALAAGKHVLTEARMAMNSKEAAEMLSAARNAPHLVAQVCLPHHPLPQLRAELGGADLAA